MVLDPFSIVDEDHDLPEDFQADVQRADGATFWGFLAALVLAQAGLFAVSLGFMLGAFRNQWALGGVLIGGGTVALALTVGIYWWHRTRDERAT